MIWAGKQSIYLGRQQPCDSSDTLQYALILLLPVRIGSAPSPSTQQTIARIECSSFESEPEKVRRYISVTKLFCWLFTLVGKCLSLTDYNVP